MTLIGRDAYLRVSSPNYPTHLWMEKEIKSVANVARRDVRECLELAAEMGEIRCMLNSVSAISLLTRFLLS
jgi:hypothetical protein